MGSEAYSQQIVKAIRKFLVDDDWHFGFDEERDVFTFGLSLHKTKLQKINYVIGVREDDYVVYAISPISADEKDPKMVAAMLEFLCRANYGMVNGNFEMDMTDGEIRFKSYVDCEGQLPSTEIIGNSIRCPAAMFDRYGDGFLKIIFGQGNPKEAVEECEGLISSSILRPSDNDQDSDITRGMLDALSEHFRTGAEKPDGPDFFDDDDDDDDEEEDDDE